MSSPLKWISPYFLLISYFLSPIQITFSGRFSKKEKTNLYFIFSASVFFFLFFSCGRNFYLWSKECTNRENFRLDVILNPRFENHIKKFPTWFVPCKKLKFQSLFGLFDIPYLSRYLLKCKKGYVFVINVKFRSRITTQSLVGDFWLHDYFMLKLENDVKKIWKIFYRKSSFYFTYRKIFLYLAWHAPWLRGCTKIYWAD